LGGIHHLNEGPATAVRRHADGIRFKNHRAGNIGTQSGKGEIASRRAAGHSEVFQLDPVGGGLRIRKTKGLVVNLADPFMTIDMPAWPEILLRFSSLNCDICALAVPVVRHNNKINTQRIDRTNTAKMSLLIQEKMTRQ